MTTIHYVTEMVEVATGKVTQLKLWTVKSAANADAVISSILLSHKGIHRGGDYHCTITKIWAA